MTVHLFWKTEKESRIILELDCVPRIGEFVQYAYTDESGICGRVKDVQWSFYWDAESVLHKDINIIIE